MNSSRLQSCWSLQRQGHGTLWMRAYEIEDFREWGSDLGSSPEHWRVLLHPLHYFEDRFPSLERCLEHRRLPLPPLRYFEDRFPPLQSSVSRMTMNPNAVLPSFPSDPNALASLHSSHQPYDQRWSPRQPLPVLLHLLRPLVARNHPPLVAIACL